eukprot:CAMPEP_0170538072 /NCGR_PEP_ID=MMETSP0209-20121228/103089_1 /TAXON_ID=665100 ORGANISM="Litonotus pictus, Strain P1" /NCGR_SAMPLE_ID=MMETSP0209 /ASSEMBLY_ACC=CAM_ASM_000301 /LENGTH=2196 /DNA_ID=CAMNT_0010839695 /DNA_START=319 /DNA_END=6909 /DNA_ORIENTATION=-
MTHGGQSSNELSEKIKDHPEFQNFMGILKSFVKIIYYLGRDNDNYLKNYLLLFYRDNNINIINKVKNRKLLASTNKFLDEFNPVSHEFLSSAPNIVPPSSMNNLEEVKEKYLNGSNESYLEINYIFSINRKLTENIKHLLYFLTFEYSLTFGEHEIGDNRKDLISAINFNDHVFSKQNLPLLKKIFKCEKETDKCRDLGEIDVKNYSVYFTHSNFSFLSSFKIKKNFKEYLKEIYIPDQESLSLPEFPKNDILLNYCFIWLDHLVQNNFDKKNYYKDIIFAYIKYAIYDDFNYCFYMLSNTSIDTFKRLFSYIPYDVIDLLNFVVCYLTQSEEKIEFRKFNRLIDLNHVTEFLETIIFSESSLNQKNVFIYPEQDEANDLMFVEGKINTRRFYPMVLHIYLHFIKLFSFFNLNEYTEALFSILLEFKLLIYKPVKSNLTPEDILNVESELTLKDVYNKFIGKKILESTDKDSSLYKYSVKTLYLKCLNSIFETYKGCLPVEKYNKLAGLMTEIFNLQLTNKKLKTFEKNPRKMIYLTEVLHFFQNLYFFLPLTSQNIIHNFNFQEFQKFNISHESYINVFNTTKTNYELIKRDSNYFNDFYSKLASYYKILKIVISFEKEKVFTNYSDSENVFHKTFEIQYSIFSFIIPMNKALGKLFEVIDHLLKDSSENSTIKMLLGKYYNVMSKYMEFVYIFFDKIFNNKPMLTTFNNFEFFKLNESFVKNLYLCYEKFTFDTINIFEISEIKNSLEKFFEFFSPLVKEQYYLLTNQEEEDNIFEISEIKNSLEKFFEFFSPLVKEQYYLLTNQEEEEKKNLKFFNFLGAYSSAFKKRLFGITGKNKGFFDYAYNKDGNTEDNTDSLRPNLFISEIIAELDSYGKDSTCLLNVIHISLFHYSNFHSVEKIILKNFQSVRAFSTEQSNESVAPYKQMVSQGIPFNENQVGISSRYYYSFLHNIKKMNEESNGNSNEFLDNELHLPLDFYLFLKVFTYNYSLDIYSVVLNSILKFNINKKPFQIMSEKFVVKLGEVLVTNPKINPIFCVSNLNLILINSVLVNTQNIMQNINNPFYNFHEITDQIIISLKIIQYTCEYQNQFFKFLMYKTLLTVRQRQTDDVVLLSLSDIFTSNIHLIGRFYLLMYDYVFENSTISLEQGNDKPRRKKSNKETNKPNYLSPSHDRNFSDEIEKSSKTIKSQNTVHSLQLVKVSPLIIKLYQSHFDTLIEIIQGSKSNLIDSFCTSKEESFLYCMENEVFNNYIGNFNLMTQHAHNKSDDQLQVPVRKHSISTDDIGKQSDFMSTEDYYSNNYNKGNANYRANKATENNEEEGLYMDANKSLSTGLKFFSNTNSLEIFKGFLTSLKELIFKSKHQRFSLAEIKNIEYKYLKKYLFIFLNSILEQNFKHKIIIKLLQQYLMPDEIQTEIFNRVIEILQNYFESKVKKDLLSQSSDKNNSETNLISLISVGERGVEPDAIHFKELLQKLEKGDDLVFLLEKQQEKKHTPFITKLFRSTNNPGTQINKSESSYNSSTSTGTPKSSTSNELRTGREREEGVKNKLILFKKKDQRNDFTEEEKKVFKDFLDDYFEVLRMMFLYTKLMNQLYGFSLNLEVNNIQSHSNDIRIILKILLLEKPIKLIKKVCSLIKFIVYKVFLIEFIKGLLSKNDYNLNRQALTNYKFDLNYWQRYINFYFLHKYISVELKNFNKTSDDDSETISVYFELPNDLEYISDSTKSVILDSIDRETPLTKINSFLNEENFKIIQSEIDFFKSIPKEKYEIYKFINDIKVWYFDVVNFLLSLLINIILLAYLRIDSDYLYPGGEEAEKTQLDRRPETYVFDQDNALTYYTGLNPSQALLFVSMVQCVYCCFYVVLWVYYKFLLKVNLNKKIEEDSKKINQNFSSGGSINYSNYSNNTDGMNLHSDSHHSKSNQVSFSWKQKYIDNFIFHEELRDFIWTLVLGLFASSSEKLYFLFGFQLMTILNLSTTLKSIISAINSKMNQLGLTVMFLIIVVYCFAILGYFFLPKEFVEESEETGLTLNYCESFFSCFIFVMDYGIRNGGGIGDVLNKKSLNKENTLFWGRFVFDILFWLIVILIMLNIVMGIVIDTFGELREKLTAEDEDKKNTCMICGKKKDAFDKFNKDFEYHLQSEHNPWNYFFYIVYIKTKDTSKRNSHENYVWNCFINEDYSWIPNTEIENASSEIVED